MASYKSSTPKPIALLNAHNNHAHPVEEHRGKTRGNEERIIGENREGSQDDDVENDRDDHGGIPR